MHFDYSQWSACGCLFLLSVDEFEASAMAKAKETEAQSEPDDGEEDDREEGNFLKCSSCIKITKINVIVIPKLWKYLDLNITP